MKTVDLYLFTGFQQYISMDGWNFRIYKVFYFNVMQLQLGIQVHAVKIIQGYLYSKRIILFQHLKRLLPSMVGFESQKNIGLVFFDQAYQLLKLLIGGQYVADQNRERSVVLLSLIGKHLLFGKKGVGIYFGHLIKNTDQEQHLHNPLPNLPLPKLYKKQPHCRKCDKRDLQPGKIKHPNPPFVTLEQGRDESQ